VAHDELNRFLLGRGLARFKLPERVETIGELPLTNVGKVNKKALREMLAGDRGSGIGDRESGIKSI
jgi:2,3-dihydroxybenzoate-AMP ligase